MPTVKMIPIFHDEQPDILKQLSDLVIRIADSNDIALFLYAAKEVPPDSEDGAVCHKAIGLCRNMTVEIAESLGGQFANSELGTKVIEGYNKEAARKNGIDPDDTKYIVH